MEPADHQTKLEAADAKFDQLIEIARELPSKREELVQMIACLEQSVAESACLACVLTRMNDDRKVEKASS